VTPDAPLRGAEAAARSATPGRTLDRAPGTPGFVQPTTGLRLLPAILTLIALVMAGILSWAAWQAYMAAPWTRDGTVLAYVVTIAPEVAGQVTVLPVADNQFVHKGDPLMTIDPRDYALAVEQAEASVAQTRINAENATREAKRREQLTTLETSEEEKQTFAATAAAADASYRQALATLGTARVNLERTQIRSPVNGYVTNLLVQQGDYANVGQNLLSVVDSDSFWVAGYFEETNLQGIRPGDRATIKLLGFDETIQGHVDSIARGITVANVQPGRAGLATVNPIFTWVRLAQRVPVRIHIDHVPPGVTLVIGQTASIQIETGSGRAGEGPAATAGAAR
jgi:multidrug resistance efflux pump